MAVTPKKPETINKTTKVLETKSPFHFPFDRSNYIVMLIGIVLIIAGFIAMIGGGAKNTTDFSESIFDFQRLTLSTILILAGFGVEIYAIMKKPKE